MSYLPNVVHPILFSTYFPPANPTYLRPLPDDVLDLVGLVSELLEAQRLHCGGESFILKQSLPLQVVLPQGVVVLAVEPDGLVQGPFPVSPFSFPDQPVAEKARWRVWHLHSADLKFFCEGGGKKTGPGHLSESLTSQKDPGINPNGYYPIGCSPA